ncbi:MAG: LLM class flavin-dependent oxidoreductase [Thermoleophilaceae bacterium]
MRYAVYAPTSGEYDVPALAELARGAERAGWAGFFVWDNLMATFDGSNVLADTTVALTAIALATERLRFGAMVTPLPRRRPWKLAKETATLDVLSGGRLVLGVGLGGTWDFAPFGEDVPLRTRGDLLDEGLDVVTRLWEGAPVDHRGRHFALQGARLVPRPVQRPRIPIWCAGYWPGGRALRRAARWDGVAPLSRDGDFRGLSPSELRRCVDYVMRHRPTRDALDVVHFQTAGDPGGTPEEYARAGATWWFESTFPPEEGLAEFRARIEAGPPR